MNLIFKVLLLSVTLFSCNRIDKLYEKYDLDQSSFLEFNEHRTLFTDKAKSYDHCVKSSVFNIIPQQFKFKAYLAIIDGDVEQGDNIISVIRRVIGKNYKSIKTSKQQMKDGLKILESFCKMDKY